MDVPSGEKKTLIMESAFDSMTYLTKAHAFYYIP